MFIVKKGSKLGGKFKFVENLRMNGWTIFYCQKGSKLGGKLVTSSNLLKFEEELLYNILLSKEFQIRG